MEKALIFVDQAARDTYGMKRIGEHLKAKVGPALKVYYCNALNSNAVLDWLKPNILVLGNVDTYHGDLARKCRDRGILVYSLPTEQMISEDDLKIKRIVGGHDFGKGSLKPPAIDCVSRMYFWSKNYADLLTAHDPALFADKAVALGCQRLVSISKLKPYDPSRRLTVGLALDDSFSFQNTLEVIQSRLEYWKDEDGISAGFEGQVAFVNYMNGKMLRILKHLFARKDVDVIVRPRFTGRLEEFDFLKKHYPRIQIDDQLSHAEFFRKSDLIVTAYSTITAESLIAGIPTISALGLWPEGVKQLVPFLDGVPPYNLGWSLGAIPELDRFIEKRRANELALAPDEAAVEKFVYETYLIRGQQFEPAEAIAEDILQDFEKKWKTVKSAPGPHELYSLGYLILKNIRIQMHFNSGTVTRRRYYFDFWGR